MLRTQKETIILTTTHMNFIAAVRKAEGLLGDGFSDKGFGMSTQDQNTTGTHTATNTNTNANANLDQNKSSKNDGYNDHNQDLGFKNKRLVEPSSP